MTKESTVRKKVAAVLKTTKNLWFAPVVGTRFGKRGVPDFVGCYEGCFFSVEVKAPGEKATSLQKHEAERIIGAGGYHCVADKAKTVKAMLDDLLHRTDKTDLTDTENFDPAEFGEDEGPD